MSGQRFLGLGRTVGLVKRDTSSLNYSSYRECVENIPTFPIATSKFFMFLEAWIQDIYRYIGIYRTLGYRSMSKGHMGEIRPKPYC